MRRRETYPNQENDPNGEANQELNARIAQAITRDPKIMSYITVSTVAIPLFLVNLANGDYLNAIICGVFIVAGFDLGLREYTRMLDTMEQTEQLSNSTAGR